MIEIEIEPVAYEKSTFCVEAATDEIADTTVQACFATESLARNAALALSKEFPWTQISEWGEWQTGNHRTSGWIAFWWTPGCGYQGTPGHGRDLGVPDGQVTPRSYSPLPRPEGE